MVRKEESPMKTTISTYPRQLYQPPIPKPSASRDLSTEEKAALWDEAAALHAEEHKIASEINRLVFKRQSFQGQREALFSQGKPKGRNEVCSLCSMETCNCERLG
jgi:cytochrome c556